MKKLIGTIIAVAMVIIGIPSTVAMAQTEVLDHVVISPLSATIPIGDSQQFTAAGQDSDNLSVTGITYTWNVVAGGGTITDDGTFTATGAADTYTNTVQVTAVKDSINKTAYASVTISTEDDDDDDEDEDGELDPKGWSHGKKTGWGDKDTQPGWSHGKKTGWNGEVKPPSWFKKLTAKLFGQDND
ncbi:MAG: hypothetical protein PHR56_08890 [Dehalococcoidales bacterium]|nr:hypothetical protein [Dehalococcoidales bacterium]